VIVMDRLYCHELFHHSADTGLFEIIGDSAIIDIINIRTNVI